jgi:hypothetical protein
VLIARQRVTEQDRVRTLGIELAVGLIGNLEWRQRDAAVELERLIGAECHHMR